MPKNTVNRAYTLQLVLKDGRSTQLQMAPIGLPQMAIDIRSADDVKSFHLSYRNVDWMTFRDVRASAN